MAESMRFSRIARLTALGVALATVAGSLPASAAGADFEREVLSDSPLAFYRLNETTATSPAADQSGNLLNGTYSSSGTTLQQVATAGDRAVGFNGGRIVVGDNPLLSPERITIETIVVWNGSTGAQQRICEKSTEPAGTTAVYNLCISAEGTPLFEVDLGNGRVALPSCVSLPENVPIHLVATHDGARLSLYVDGALATSIAQIGTLNRGSTQPFAIGNQAERERAFNGMIDEVALYDRALSPERILAHARTIPELTGVRVDCLTDGGPDGTVGSGGTGASGGTQGDGGVTDSGGAAGTLGSGGSAAGSAGDGGAGGTVGVGATSGSGSGGTAGLAGEAGSGGGPAGTGGVFPPDGAAGINDLHSKPTVDVDGDCACRVTPEHRNSLAWLAAVTVGLLFARRRPRTR
jgi:MYXO-CTERM domain-containing protein